MGKVGLCAQHKNFVSDTLKKDEKNKTGAQFIFA